MANYNIVADTSNFKPISYEQMMAPINQVTKYILDQRAENDKINEAMADLQYAVQNSPEAKEAYDKYQNEFNNYASNFNDTPDGSIFRNGLALRDRYFREIKPMEKAHEALKQVLDTRNKLAASGKRMVYTNPSLNLDMFMKGDYNETSADLDAITNRVAAKAKAYSQTLLEDPEVKQVLGKQQFQLTEGSPIQMNDIDKAMYLIKSGQLSTLPISDSAKSKIEQLGSIVQDEMNNIGINQYDSAGKDAITGAIKDGLYGGMTEAKREYKANAAYESPAQAQSRQLSNARIIAELHAQGYDQNGNYHPEYVTQHALDQAEAQRQYYAALGIDPNGNSNNVSMGIDKEGNQITMYTKPDGTIVNASTGVTINKTEATANKDRYLKQHPEVIAKNTANSISPITRNGKTYYNNGYTAGIILGVTDEEKNRLYSKEPEKYLDEISHNFYPFYYKGDAGDSDKIPQTAYDIHINNDFNFNSPKLQYINFGDSSIDTTDNKNTALQHEAIFTQQQQEDIYNTIKKEYPNITKNDLIVVYEPTSSVYKDRYMITIGHRDRTGVLRLADRSNVKNGLQRENTYKGYRKEGIPAKDIVKGYVRTSPLDATTAQSQVQQNQQAASQTPTTGGAPGAVGAHTSEGL